MENLNTYTELNDEALGYARGRALKRAQPRLLVTRFGLVDSQPRNSTRTRTWTRYNRPAPATSPLAEGISPKGSKVTLVTIKAQLEQYGDVLRFTDRMISSARDPILKYYSELAGEQAAETVETVDLAALCSGTNVYYASGVAGRSSVVNKISRGDLRGIVRSLVRQGAQPVTRAVKASGMIATEPVAPGFIAFCHPDLAPDIRDLTGFLPVEKYSDQGSVEPFEIGKCEEVRFIAHSLLGPYYAAGSAAAATWLNNGVVPSGNAAADVYPILIFGQEAYATVPLAGEESIKINVINPKAQIGDECGQRGAVSWITDHTCAILYQSWMMRYEVAATAVPA